MTSQLFSYGGVNPRARRDCTTRFLVAFSMAAALAALPVRASAQVATGNIRGVVVDSTDAVIRSAKVTLTNSGTGLQRIVTTNESGDFNAPFMPLGDYQIAAEVAGFSKKVLTGINLQVDQTATIRIVLEPGTATQSVEVTSAAPLLDAQLRPSARSSRTSAFSSCR